MRSADKDKFLSALKRLGSVSAAVEELGFSRNVCYSWAKDVPSRRVRPSREEFTQLQKDEFLAVLDRVGSMTAAARELDLDVGRSFRWAYQADAVAKRPRKRGRTNQRITPDQKQEFFRVLDEVDSVSIAAKQLGLNRKTCSGWAHKAGIASIHPDTGRKEEFLRHRRAGLTQAHARRMVGADPKTAYHWDNDIVKVKGTYARRPGLAMQYKDGSAYFTRRSPQRLSAVFFVGGTKCSERPGDGPVTRRARCRKFPKEISEERAPKGHFRRRRPRRRRGCKRPSHGHSESAGQP